jgi:hypothetical protein
MAPVGSSQVPVAYQIIAKFDAAEEIATKVNFTGKPAFHKGSYLPTVIGDEAGVGGGLSNGSCKGKCYPITHSKTVRIQGQWLVRHDDLFEMNCSSPGNTLGRALYNEVSSKIAANENGETVVIEEQRNSTPESQSLREAYANGEDVHKVVIEDGTVKYTKHLPDGSAIFEQYNPDGEVLSMRKTQRRIRAKIYP